MVAFSKPTVVDISCYELGHTWTPSCSKAFLDVFLLVFKQSIKIYSSVYLIAGLIRKRDKTYFKQKVWKEILQSTAFLTINGSLFIACFCVWRKLAGFYFYLSAIVCGIPASALSLSIERKERRVLGSTSTWLRYVNSIAFIPCLVASFVAILQERKSRRGLLAVYMGNTAIETLWRMFEARGWVKSMPYGEVLLFSVASSIYLYFFKKTNGLPEGTHSIFRKVFGSSETIPTSLENGQVEEEDIARASTNGALWSQSRQSGKGVHTQILNWLQQTPAHPVCRHKYGCVYYVLQGSARMFGIGYAVQAGFKFLGSLRKVFKQPKGLITALVNTGNLQLGAFLASFVGIYRAVNCVLRWLRKEDSSMHGLVAGFLAGWSMMFYKSSTIALYTACKLAEMLYFKGIESKKLPYIRCADIIIYSISTALVFHAAVLEPHNLRPAYWNFLLKITGDKFASMNRRLLDPYVPNCSKLYPDFWPTYDPRFTKLVKPPS